MRKVLLLILLGLAVLPAGEAMAQTLQVSGRVLAEDGAGIPGVNVVTKGTTSGTVTDADGRYSLSVEPDAVLVFSFIGYATTEQAVNNRTTIDVRLQQDVTQLNEVVVTALGIERSRNELAYSAQKVTGDQVAQTRGVNFVNALAGKVAGLDIKSSNTMGGSTNVVIRGYKSITGNNQALFVIDGVPVSNANTNTAIQRGGGTGVDYGNAAADINPDNIASIDVLKGAAATALYGSRAANGVVMITTKKGKKNNFDVTVNSGITWGKIDKSTFARYQKEYGAGYSQDFSSKPLNLDDGERPTVVFGDDASYGPKFDGSLVYQWDALDKFGPNYRKATPWRAAKNDPSTFYETAVSSNQSILVSAGGEKATFKFGYNRSDEKGVLPNSTLDKDLVNFSTSYDITPKLTIAASANYSRIVGIGRFGTGYNGKNPNQNFRQWAQVNVDMKEQRAAYFRNRQNITWNWNAAGTGPLYSDNPYFSRYENFSNDGRDHFFGYATLNYKATEWLSLLGRVAFDNTADLQEERLAVTSSGTPYYSRYNRNYNEANFDFIANVDKKLSEVIDLKGLIGANIRRTRLNAVRGTTNGGLVVPGLYSLSNSVNPIAYSDSRLATNANPYPSFEEFERVGVDGIFAQATVGIKELVYIELAARQDKSTTLPIGDNSYFYPSAGANFVFSNIYKPSWLSHGKFRVNYAEVGNDATALSINSVYDKPAGLGSVPLFSLPSTKNNQGLKSERTKSIEAGLEVEFLDERIGFDFTYYRASSFDQILPVNVTPATGYTALWVNSGEVQNKGIEISAFGTPVRTQDFSWTVNVNFTRNRNEVVSLYGEGENEVSNFVITPLQGGVSLNAAKGQPFGAIRGTDFIYTNGQRTVNEDGYYARTSRSDIVIGNPNPDWTGGVSNTLRYKDVALNFLVDIRHGGDIFSLDQWYGEATGLYQNSAGLNARGVESRLPVAQGGGILLSGVQADGTPNTIYGENLDGYGQTPFGYVANGEAGAPHKWYVYDGSYIKLREVALTYSLPQTFLSKIAPFKSVDISIIGRNLWIIKKNMEYSDPEEGLSSGNAAQGYQSGAYPMVRNYGFNVKLSF